MVKSTVVARIDAEHKSKTVKVGENDPIGVQIRTPHGTLGLKVHRPSGHDRFYFSLSQDVQASHEVMTYGYIGGEPQAEVHRSGVKHDNNISFEEFLTKSSDMWAELKNLQDQISHAGLELATLLGDMQVLRDEEAKLIKRVQSKRVERPEKRRRKIRMPDVHYGEPEH